MTNLEAVKTIKENVLLRASLNNCLILIDKLSHLDAPLFEADLTIEEKVDYVRTVNNAKRILDMSH
jgi:hypothetical protein